MMKYRIPTVREYYILKYSANTANVVAIAKTIADFDSPAEFQSFLNEYFEEIEAERASNPQLQTPYYAEYSDEKQYYNCNSTDMKIVADYTRLDFCQIQELGIFTFWGWLHDAIVWNCNKSDEGKDYLEMCWTNLQTEPDRKALRKILE